MTASKIFLYFCLFFIGGIFLNSIITISQLLMLGFLILGILLISVFWQHKNFVIIGFCILFLAAGVWRHEVGELKVINNELKNYNDLDQKITLIGQVIKEPDIRERNIKLEIANLKLQIDSKWKDISGKMLVTTNRYPEYQYGDKLKITGKLKTPPEFEDFNYKNFLAKDGIYSVISWPKIELIEKNQGNFVYAKILEFKNKLRESIYQNLSPPQSSILGAIILGDQRKMSEGLKEELNITGVRHITAISGMHITILSVILMQILIGLGLWRSQAFYLTLVLLILFIVMVGLPPSAVRAGIMGGLFLLAQYLGKMNTSSRAIVFAAALILIQNPLLLRLDVGFQLSFLAMLGIIYLSPIFREWIKKIPVWPKDILAMTLAAQIFTLPILIYNFGYFSSIAPITNVLIVPLLPAIMILGFVFGLVGIVFQPLAWILSWPAWLLLTYLTEIVDWLSNLPWAAYSLEISWIWLVISYLILGFLTWRLNEKFTRPSFLR